MATQTIEVQTELVEIPQSQNDAQMATDSDERAAPTGPKYDRVTILKLISAGFSFFVAGVNDGSMGPLVPYFMREYQINTTIVSVL